MRRLTGLGPLTVRQEELSIDDIERMVVDIVEQNNIDPDDPSAEDIDQVITEVSKQLYPDTSEGTPTMMGAPLPKRVVFEECMYSSWVEGWETGTRAVTTELASDFEQIIVRVNGCHGISEAENPFATTLAFSDLDISRDRLFE